MFIGLVATEQRERSRKGIQSGGNEPTGDDGNTPVRDDPQHATVGPNSVRVVLGDEGFHASRPQYVQLAGLSMAA